MKILSLGLDNSVLNKDSALARRIIEYGSLVEKYDVIVPSQKNEKIELSEKVKVYGSGGGSKLARLIKIYNLARKLLRQNKYDVITVQDQYYLALIGLRLSRKFKVGLEIQAHGFEKFYDARKLIARYVLPRAGVVRCVSQRLKKRLVSEFGVKEEKIAVVPIYSENRNWKLEIGNLENKKEKGNFVFLTVGRLAPVKNIGLQIEAMREVVKRHPEAELWIVGDGPEFNNLKFKILNFKLSDNVKLFGQKNREELKKFYNQTDAFILTSDSEGWGLAVIEAATVGLPIIMTEVGCAGEAIINNESGIIVPVGDRQKLVEAMLRLMADAGLREKLAGGAKLAISRLPTEEETSKLYIKSWEKAAKNN